MTACNVATSSALVSHDCRTWHAVDQERWKDLFDPSRLWDDPVWVRQTQYQNAGVYTRYLAALRKAGARAPRFVTPRGLQYFIRSYEVQCCPRTIAGYAWALYKMASLLWPNRDKTWLVKSCAKLDTVASRTSKQKIHRIVDAEELLWLAHLTLDKARAAPFRDWHATELFRTGLYILVGVHMPERLRALASLRLDQIDLDNNGAAFKAKAIKMKRDRPWVLPPKVIAIIREWSTEWRALWLENPLESTAPQHNRLWITKGGTPAGDAALTESLRLVTTECFGFPVTSHRFRDAAATLLVEIDPENTDVARQVLGHSSDATLEEYIETANQVNAGRALTESLDSTEESLRRRLRQTSRAAIALNPASRRRRRRRT